MPVAPAPPQQDPTSVFDAALAARDKSTIPQDAINDFAGHSVQNSLVNAPAAPVPPIEQHMTSAQVSDQQSRELILGVAEGLGIDPSHPLTSIITSAINAPGFIARMATHSQERSQVFNGIVNAIPETKNQILNGYNNGDWDQVANGVGRAIALGGVIYGGAKALKRPLSAMAEGMGARPPELPPSGGYGQPKPEVPVHVQQFSDAVGPEKIFAQDRFHEAVNNAFPALNEAEHTTLGRNVIDRRDAIKVASAASKNTWAPYKQLLDATQTPITKLDLLRTANKYIPDAIKKNNTAAYKNMIGQFARRLGQNSYTAAEIENAAQGLNAELKAYYTKNNLERAAANKLPATAGDEALLSAYRELGDAAVKNDTGYDPVPLRKQYGDVKAVHNALIGSTAGGDDTLFDVILRHPSNFIKPTGMAKTIAKYGIRSSPDQLVAKAFRGYEPEKQTPGLVLTPGERTRVNARPVTPPETPVAPPGGFPMPPSTEAPVPPRLTSGTKQLPASGATSVKVTPQPPESFIETLKRQETPQSRRMREVVGQGSFNIEAAPVTADDYVKTLGGRKMSRSEILSDRNFQALSDIERLKALHNLDPEYRKLPPKERWREATRAPRPPTKKPGG